MPRSPHPRHHCYHRRRRRRHEPEQISYDTPNLRKRCKKKEQKCASAETISFSPFVNHRLIRNGELLIHAWKRRKKRFKNGRHSLTRKKNNQTKTPARGFNQERKHPRRCDPVYILSRFYFIMRSSPDHHTTPIAQAWKDAGVEE